MIRSKILIAFVCIGSALEGCASRKPAESEPAQVSVPLVEATAASLNIRATPSSRGAVVGSLKRGERARAPEPEADGWLYVESDTGTTGYVATKYVLVVEESATPATAPAKKSAPATAPAEKHAADPPESAATKPAPGTRLARITLGMAEGQVTEILGKPTSEESYITGKAFIPYYYGPDTRRIAYRYKGVGIVVFSRGQFSDAAKVSRVIADANEDGYP